MNKLKLSILKVRKIKKTAILIMSLLLAVGAAAQSHSFGDTSYVKFKYFDYVSWFDADQTHGVYSNGIRVSRPSEVVQFNYTDNPNGLKVVGLSGVMATNPVFFGNNPEYPMDPPDYLVLYDALTDDFELKAMEHWEVTDTAGRPWLDWIAETSGGKRSFLSVYGINPPHYYSVFDLYFNEPVTVYDSFYVGGTVHNDLTKYFAWNMSILDTITYTIDTTSYKPILRKISHTTPNQWHWYYSNTWMLIHPIIEVVDTSFANAPVCPRVAGLFARGNHTDTVTVQWSPDSLHTEFELSYGHEGIRPEDGTIVTLNDTTRWQFTDTAYSDTPMVAFVRTVCREYDTLRWSGWSSPVYWRLHHEGTNHEGIEVPDDPSDLARFVRLMPNPASNRVLVMSSYGIESMEVYDVRGNRVLEQKGAGRGTTADFDVSAWAKGAYVVLVHTPAGTTAKRLVVN